MADSDFKSAPITFPKEWQAHSSGSVIGAHKYKPDRSFKDEEGRVVCIVESTSTNDRKVGVGELCLADKFFADAGTYGILIFSLCGKSKYPPRPSTQLSYLEPYFHHIRSAASSYGVTEIFFIKEEEFEQLGWCALGEEFLSKSVALKA